MDDPALFIRINNNQGGEGDAGAGTKNKSKDKGGKTDEGDPKGKKKAQSEKCMAPSKLTLALEYLDLVRQYPVKMKGVVFHIRRLLRDDLTRYQLMEDCVGCKSAEEVRGVVEQAVGYAARGDYQFDPHKERRLKEVLEKRKREEGKRKAFEERMMRKAKREGREAGHYLSVGAEVPSLEELAELRLMVGLCTLPRLPACLLDVFICVVGRCVHLHCHALRLMVGVGVCVPCPVMVSIMILLVSCLITFVCHFSWTFVCGLQPKEQAFEVWKAKHSQHCYNFHFEAAGCHRDRTCSFLHADPTYSEAVAYG